MVLIWSASLSFLLTLEGGEVRAKSCLGWQGLTLQNGMMAIARLTAE